ncbi:hypothetical protein [Halothiobacillus sp.]|uniref:hypothetical protein n=1 Tax=Halothiobacillus sp. TaxID=1891311 RepID=UPI0026018735|nr:hypothetical protein [Halothiobacillus sp.]
MTEGSTLVDSVAEVIALDEEIVNEAKRSGSDEGSSHIMGVVTQQSEKGNDKLIILVDLKGLSDLGEK